MKYDFKKFQTTISFEIAISSLVIIFGMFLGYLVNHTPFKSTMDEFQEIRNSDVIGSIGTIYALITAFILVNAWNHYNETSKIYSQETEALMHLWNFIDFLDEADISRAMQIALTTYINTTLDDEFNRLAKRKLVYLPSVEFTRILRILDTISIGNDQEAVNAIMSTIIGGFKDLSHARSQRIEFSLTKIPEIIKFFYILASFIFWLGYLLQGFESMALYYFILFITTLIVVVAHTIIFDLDKPLTGLLKISLRNYEICKSYIMETEHVD